MKTIWKIDPAHTDVLFSAKHMMVTTVRGVTKPVVFDAEFGGIVPGMSGARHVGFTLKSKINRQDWCVNWNVALGGDSWLVGNEVKLEIEVAADEVASVAESLKGAA